MEFIISFFLIRYLRKSLEGTDYYAKWDRPFQIGMVLSGIFFVIAQQPFGQDVISWIGKGLLLGLMIMLLRREEFLGNRLLLVSLLPMVIIAFASELTKLISPSFHNAADWFFDIGQGFAFLWLVASFILFRRQKKALDKERKLREAEEEKNRITAARKAELEVLVAERTSEILQQKDALEHTLEELRNAQQQLVHAEKMASLGELTAGIAHEIQNPLNFVKNFSELNAELVDELLEELRSGRIEEARELAENLRDNEQKISHHSKRADAIVKSMLQHSRMGHVEKEPTDLNAMADECMRLSYHGMRARDKSFHAQYHLHLHPDLPACRVVPQDISRVLLNLLTNAFYAVRSRERDEEPGYKPQVDLSTRLDGNWIHIEILDNGKGIPDDLKEKIFQPFFTTKPTGEGTGLGLSLSYDIITKGHGGRMAVQSEPGEYTRFTVSLPLTQAYPAGNEAQTTTDYPIP